MNINELLQELKKRNISLSGRAISKIWGMDETSFSKKKKLGTQIKQINITQLEKALGIKILNQQEKNTLEKRFVPKYEINKQGFGARISEIQNKNNLSIFQMALLLNITEKELFNIIEEKNQLNLYLLDKIKQNFIVSIDWLLYGEK